jgi:hypothetical protein
VGSNFSRGATNQPLSPFSRKKGSRRQAEIPLSPMQWCRRGDSTAVSLGGPRHRPLRRGFGLTPSPKSPGTFLVHFRDEGEECPRPFGALAGSSPSRAPVEIEKAPRFSERPRISTGAEWCRRGDSNPHGSPHHPLKPRPTYEPLESLYLLKAYGRANITHSVDLGRFCTASQDFGHKLDTRHSVGSPYDLESSRRRNESLLL